MDKKTLYVVSCYSAGVTLHTYEQIDLKDSKILEVPCVDGAWAKEKDYGWNVFIRKEDMRDTALGAFDHAISEKVKSLHAILNDIEAIKKEAEKLGVDLGIKSRGVIKGDSGKPV